VPATVELGVADSTTTWNPPEVSGPIMSTNSCTDPGQPRGEVIEIGLRYVDKEWRNVHVFTLRTLPDTFCPKATAREWPGEC
jgi:hypothetical protein